MILAVISTQGWKCNSLDIKAAFLQGRSIDREVYLRPPPDLAKPGIVWKLKKCVYGLADASRVWYLRVKEVLLQLGTKLSCYDQALFFYHVNSKLQGVMLCHVDDFLWAGTQCFVENVITPFKMKFSVGQECETCFRYIGINLSENSDRGIIFDQVTYCGNVVPMNLDLKADKTSPLNTNERSQLRSLIGQLNWAACQSRPDIAFDTCVLSTCMRSPTVADVVSANKIVRRLHTEQTRIMFPRLCSLTECTLSVFADASFANLSDGASQGGYVILLKDKMGKCCPLSWQSHRIKRITRSTLAAETLAMVEAAESAILLSHILGEIIHGSKQTVPIKCFTDNKSLYDTSNTTKTLLDKRLRVDMSSLREMCDDGTITLQWIEKSEQISDVLTKKGAAAYKLLNILRRGQLE